MNQDHPVKTGSNQGGSTKWKPGQSGNPNGRPPGTLSLITILKQKLSDIHEGTNKTNAELLVDRVLKSAIADANDQQIKNILQYIEGMPKQSIEHSGEVAVPILGSRSNVRSDNGNEQDTQTQEAD